MMTNTETHYEMTIREDVTNHEWNEKMEGWYKEAAPTKDEAAIRQAKQIVEEFNENLRPYEKKRRLVCVQRVDVQVTDVMEYVTAPDDVSPFYLYLHPDIKDTK